MGIENKDRLVHYWLGELSDAEKLRLEKECLADDRLSEALKEAESDLLDSYVCGELSEEQRKQFEQNYLDSPRKHEQIEIARLLMNPAVRQRIAATAIPARQEERSWWRWTSFFSTGNLAVRLASVTAGMAIATLLVLLMIQNHRLRMEVSRLEAQQTKLHEQIAELQQNSNKPPQDGSSSVIVSALLKPGLSREGGSANGNPPLIIPVSSSAVVLLLDLSSNRYSSYNVVVETVEGKVIHRAQDLTAKSYPGGRVVQATLPAQALPKGDYIVTISGVKSNNRSQVIDSYTFSVSR